jgi:hypothetical protein
MARSGFFDKPKLKFDDHSSVRLDKLDGYSRRTARGVIPRQS